MNPMFLALLVAVTVLLLAVIVAYVVVRPQRTREWMAALEKGTDAQKSFLELVKYVTGAVFGSMFGKGGDTHASNAKRS